jgi:hypothetical protein
MRTRDLLVTVGARVAALTPEPLPVPEARFADIVDLDELRVPAPTSRPVQADRGGLTAAPTARLRAVARLRPGTAAG